MSDDAGTVIRISNKQVLAALVASIAAVGSIIITGFAFVYNFSADTSERFELFQHGEFADATDRIAILELESEIVKHVNGECEDRHNELSAELTDHIKETYNLHKENTESVSTLKADNRAQDRMIADCMRRTQ